MHREIYKDYYSKLYYETRFFLLEMFVVLSALAFIVCIWFLVFSLLGRWIQWFAKKNGLGFILRENIFSFIKGSVIASIVAGLIYLVVCLLLALTTSKQKPYIRVAALEIYMIQHRMYDKNNISTIREQMSRWGYGENVKSEESNLSKSLKKGLEIFANKAFLFILELFFGGFVFSIVAGISLPNGGFIKIFATNESSAVKPASIAIILVVTISVFVFLLIVTAAFLMPQLTSPVMDGEEIQRAFSDDLQYILVNFKQNKFAADSCATFIPDQNFGNQLTYDEERKCYIVKEGDIFSCWCPIYRHLKDTNNFPGPMEKSD